MKNPNGFGSVHKLSGNRRNPWRARKTIGWDENGKQLYQTIGYYKNRQLAIQALADYNENPYDIKTDSITFSEVYEKWSEEHFATIVPSAIRTWKSAYNYCKPIYNVRFKDLRVSHLEETIKNADVGSSTKARIKSMFNLLFKYAMKHDICDKDYASLCNSVKKGKPEIERINILLVAILESLFINRWPLYFLGSLLKYFLSMMCDVPSIVKPPS
jgi:hypothetical protein